MYDVIIVGAGPVGLRSALMLGRKRRTVLVCDTGKPRNAASHGMHGFISRDGMPPREFLRVVREQMTQYETVAFRDVEVTCAECIDGRFHVSLDGGERLTSRKLLIATGVVDHVPDIPGFDRLYGISVFHCPYCDGWEVRDRPLAIYGRGARGSGLALELTLWSRDLVLCSDGPCALQREELARLERNGLRGPGAQRHPRPRGPGRAAGRRRRAGANRVCRGGAAGTARGVLHHRPVT